MWKKYGRAGPDRPQMAIQYGACALCAGLLRRQIHVLGYVTLPVWGPKRDEVTEEWRKLHNEELNDLYSLPNIVRVVKSRRMR
jgi:hypothetical protein